MKRLKKPLLRTGSRAKNRPFSSVLRQPLFIRLGMGLAAVVLIGLLWVLLFSLGSSERLPDFSQDRSTAEKKAAFSITSGREREKALADIQSDRERLLAIDARFQSDAEMKRRDAKWVRKLAAHYELELNNDASLTATEMNTLKGRVDVIPLGLILAQASIESAWGSSRFARQGNNLFGMRCYTPGCGMVPKRRAAGARFEVTRFDNLAHCFTEYLHNLNTHRAYADLRRIRRQLHREGKPLTGYRLAPGLSRYSEEGWAYVQKIQSVISSNRLDASHRRPQARRSTQGPAAAAQKSGIIRDRGARHLSMCAHVHLFCFAERKGGSIVTP